MVSFSNPLWQLKRENLRMAEDIKSQANKSMVVRMVHYLEASPLSLLQVEVIHKDLIGFALEADREKLTLAEKLGVGEKDFCDEMIQDAAGYPVGREYIFRELVSILWYFVFLYALDFILFHSAPKNWGISSLLLVTTLIYYGFSRILTRYIKNKYALHDQVYMRYAHVLSAISGITFYSVFAVIWGEAMPRFLIAGNGWVLLLVLVLIAMAWTAVMNHYWNHIVFVYFHHKKS